MVGIGIGGSCDQGYRLNHRRGEDPDLHRLSTPYIWTTMPSPSDIIEHYGGKQEAEYGGKWSS